MPHFLTIMIRKTDFLLDHCVYEADLLRAFTPHLDWIPATLSSSARPRLPTILRELHETPGLDINLHAHSADMRLLYFTYQCGREN
jgi:hypothetical protein